MDYLDSPSFREGVRKRVGQTQFLKDLIDNQSWGNSLTRVHLKHAYEAYAFDLFDASAVSMGIALESCLLNEGELECKLPQKWQRDSLLKKAMEEDLLEGDEKDDAQLILALRDLHAHPEYKVWPRTIGHMKRSQHKWGEVVKIDDGEVNLLQRGTPVAALTVLQEGVKLIRSILERIENRC